MDLFQAAAGPDEIYPDGISINEALSQMTTLADSEKPFFLAVGILRPHLPFGAPQKYHVLYEDVTLPATAHPSKPAGKTTWHGSGEFMKYNRWGRNPNSDAAFALDVRKAYAACVSYADAQVGKLLSRLEELGQRENTIVVLWGDHGWHLGEHAIWGKHSLFEESLHSPMIISAPTMKKPGKPANAMVETLDIYPTLCDLAGLTAPKQLDGESLVPILNDPSVGGHSAIAYSSRAQTIRTETHRLILHRDGFAELYDHSKPAAETKNIAQANQKLVSELSRQLKQRLAQE